MPRLALVSGVLIKAGALWEHGFGVVFPELDGDSAFDNVGRVLDLIEALPVRCVIPGHGAPFTDVAGALKRARTRLEGFRADPLRHGARVMLKYHLMEEWQQPLPEMRARLNSTTVMASIWQQMGRPTDALAPRSEQLLQDMVAGGTLQLRDRVVHDL